MQSIKSIKRRLADKPKDWLLDSLALLATTDHSSMNRLTTLLAADEPNSTKFWNKIKKQLDSAAEQVEMHGPATVDDPSPTEAFESVHAILKMLVRKLPEEVIELSEYAIIKLDDVFDYQYDTELVDHVDAFIKLHQEAFMASDQDKIEFARRMAKLNATFVWAHFDGPPKGYEKVLGVKGIKVFEVVDLLEAKKALARLERLERRKS